MTLRMNRMIDSGSIHLTSFFFKQLNDVTLCKCSKCTYMGEFCGMYMFLVL